MAQSLKVAVIGAGLAGLTTSHELKKQGHKVVMFEKSDKIGGTWVYDPEVEEEDLLGLNPNRKRVHSSLYQSLHTNLPIQLMRLSDYPFPVHDQDHELRQTNFVSHEEVLKLLNDFAKDFGLVELVRFNAEVVRVEQRLSSSSEGDHDWIVEWRSPESHNVNGSSVEEIFEAVVVCNGHNTQPRIADFPGFKEWPGLKIHAHNYRQAEKFKDQVVIVVGNAASAKDIAHEISKVAKQVHCSCRSSNVKPSKLSANMWQHLKIVYCHENGEVDFEEGDSVAADVILLCNGYDYELSFLRTNGIVTIDNCRVGPLYKHVFPPELAPRLAFVGIHTRDISFPSVEAQAKWVAHVLSGKVNLPTKDEMLASVEEHYRFMEENNIPKHLTHYLKMNFDYTDWVLGEIGEPLTKKWYKELAAYITKIAFITPCPWGEIRPLMDTWIRQNPYNEDSSKLSNGAGEYKTD